jgi:hypothetical protein
MQIDKLIQPDRRQCHPERSEGSVSPERNEGSIGRRGPIDRAQGGQGSPRLSGYFVKIHYRAQGWNSYISRVKQRVASHM